MLDFLIWEDNDMPHEEIYTYRRRKSVTWASASSMQRQDSDWLKAVLLCSEGWTVPKISQALKVHQTTIIRHINEYHDGKLKDESQTEELIAHLEAHTYHHVHKIILFVKDKWGISFSISGMNK